MVRKILGLGVCCSALCLCACSSSNKDASMGAVSGEKAACCKEGDKAACCKNGDKAACSKDGAKAEGACCKDKAASGEMVAPKNN